MFIGEEVEITAEIGPIIRDGELAVLPMTLESESEFADLRTLLSGLGAGVAASYPAQVRLIDTHSLNVIEPVWHSGRYAVGTETSSQQTEDGLAWWGSYAAPEADSIAVLLPQVGLIPEIPVIEGELPEPDFDYVDRNLDYDELTAYTFPIESYRENAHLDVSTGQEGGQSTVTIASDVLFEVNESELTSEADAALETAAAELDGVEGGDLSIVGHTDNVQDEEHNQVLSEDRAESVHSRLGELADLSVFDSVSVTGESFREPVADNDTEDGRALNRRVELRFTSPEELHSTEDVDGEVPDPHGPVGDASSGVEVEREDTRVNVTVDSIQRVDNLFVGLISLELRDEGPAAIDFPLTTGGHGYQPGSGGVSRQFVARAPTLLVGDQRVFPLSYRLDFGADDDAESDETLDVRSLVDQNVSAQYSQGEALTSAVAVLWPALNTDTVTVDVPSASETLQSVQTMSLTPWRVEDVEVTEPATTGTGPDDPGDDDSDAEN